MTTFGMVIGSAVLILAADPSPPSTPPKLTAQGVEFFESKIRPILTQRCYSCHSAQAKEVKGGLLLDTRDGLRTGGESGAAIVPGDVDESLLIQAIQHETYEMPPGEKLADNVIADFSEWIRMGAPDPRTGKERGRTLSLTEARSFWSFRRPVAVPAPVVRDSAWPLSDIDRFVLARLEQKQLHPVAAASRETLIRRAFLDLTGLPPAPQDIQSFLADDSPSSFERLVDKLLESPHFGERWGRHWLDVARYGESTGKERNVSYPHAWRYRDYVIDAFNQDKPYDRFIREQVAGDLISSSSVAERNTNLVATGFLAIGTRSLNERNREQYLMDQADEQIDVVTRVFMGVTVACARCHDHKFDPITQADYYAVAGIFRSTETLSGVKAGNNKTGFRGELAALQVPGTKPKLSPETVEEIARLEEELKEVRARRQALTASRSAAAKSPQKSKAKAPDSAKKTADALARVQSRIGKLTEQIAQLKTQVPDGGSPVMAVRDADRPVNCRINIRGEVKELGDEVPRGVPFVLAFDRRPKFDTSHSGRTQLAGWLVSRENPLTARVMVNRVWAHLFGRGIVESVDNFGALGEEPTHPELLDYLALRFMEQGWSVKKMIKEIMLSRAYQMGSFHQDQGYAADPDNRLLWRMNRRRLEAEALRDSILAVSGSLNRERPNASDSSTADSSAPAEIGRGRGDAGFNEFRHRSVYLPYVRGRMPEALTLFDAADPSLIVGQRDVTTVATQALFMMNSPFVVAQADSAADRVARESAGSDADRIRYAFQLVLGKNPTVEQVDRSLHYLSQMQEIMGSEIPSEARKRSAWSSFCQMLIASAEFRYVY